jgi:hypothetical protein
MKVSRLYCPVAMKMGHAFLFLDKCKESLIACCQHKLLCRNKKLQLSSTPQISERNPIFKKSTFSSIK